ncbi:MAG: PQQ-binding-like beta-propeller repeat protein [Deltaproteobacteria bacterium]|nr:PQQ-binding-like beta-propeller repeat protein [Deltaproteobacteria bacterium]
MVKDTLQLPSDFHTSVTQKNDRRLDRDLRSLLVGSIEHVHELPVLSELISAVISLANGTRHKVILPLSESAAEFALVRRGEQVRIDFYGTESVPELFLRDRTIPLRTLVDACARAARAIADTQPESVIGQAMLQVAQRAEQSALVEDPHFDLLARNMVAGAVDDPGEQVPLAFGLSACVLPSVDTPNGSHSFADVHALLFDGELWVYSRGRRFSVTRGPVMLAIQRMVTAAKILVEAWQAGRELNARLCSQSFTIGIRLGKEGSVAMTLGGGQSDSLTIPALDVANATLPILRLASDVTRALIALDRIQARNLRITGLRGEIRLLRRIVLTHDRLDGFEADDPERLRLSATEPSQLNEISDPIVRIPEGRLRYTERWSAEIDGLDAGTTFLCGDRIVVATAKLALALCRDRGEVIWSQPSMHASYFLTGKVLLRLLANGEVELCDLEYGSVFARGHITPRSAGPPLGMFAGGGNIPPVAILAEGRQRLVALDLRTGEPRWRFKSHALGPVRLCRAGRLLLVAGGGGSIDALDVASGEVVWRFSERARFCLAPSVTADVVIACSGEPGNNLGFSCGIDLYSGRLLWRRMLDSAANASPINAGSVVVIPVGGLRNSRVVGVDPSGGELLWNVPDPGIGRGGTALQVDDLLIVNSPSGRVCALDLLSGAIAWSRVLSDPTTDDVPRQLEPVLRHGALFVPTARVHVLRPADGVSLGNGLDCDLVPDFLRVDERGWAFIAEESGYLRSYAPAPYLSVVH